MKYVLALFALAWFSGCQSGGTCMDGQKNGTESDVDCGGSCSDRCVDGKACTAAADCQSGVCTAGSCAVPTCTDGAKNGGESDVDCGGTCGKCANNKSCTAASDCQSGMCSGGSCAGSGCTDGAKNGSESDVDCGGTCAPCAQGKICAMDSDCQSQACDANRCVMASVLSSISPAQGATTGGLAVSLTGVNFPTGAGLQVLFDQVAATNVQSVSTTQINATSPVRTAATLSDVTVQLPSGRKLTLAKAFNYYWGKLQWKAAVTTSVGMTPIDVRAGDLNKDGKLDVVVSNYGASSVSVLLGNGDGTFKAKVDYTTATNPTRAAISDLDGDGKLDIAVANYGAGSVSVLIGNGDGTFKTKVDYPTGTGPVLPLVVDVTGDGKADLVVSNSGTNTVSVLPGNGNGTFQAKKDAVAVAGPYNMLAADLNGDGKQDLAVTSLNTSAVAILMGNGDGTFKTAVTYATPSTTIGLGMGDFNKDGYADLAVGSFGGSMLSILNGKGDGTFNTAVNTNLGMANQSAVEVLDLDRDGRLDLLITTQQPAGNNVYVITGKGDGSFNTPANLAGGNTPRHLAIADFNADGKDDLVMANAADNTVGFFSGNHQ